MGDLDQILLYYGAGRSVFSSVIERVDARLRDFQSTRLCEIMSEQGSDKGLGWHNYTVLYEELFSNFVPSCRCVFELGLGTNNTAIPSNMGIDGVPGASLRGWSQYFPSAEIFGADIDSAILFQEPRIKTYYVDQTNPVSIDELWRQIEPMFDLIIDDGLHEFSANSIFLSKSIHKLRKDGIYIIEDIELTLENIEKFNQLFVSTGLSGFIYRLPSRRNSFDNVIGSLCGSEYMSSR